MDGRVLTVSGLLVLSPGGYEQERQQQRKEADKRSRLRRKNVATRQPSGTSSKVLESSPLVNVPGTMSLS
ncbi:hypothetical protein DACRYDRAFT_21887 [Dacryopinax primogenitus]|uniref:BZIP domain-containing protein n=1 Tax=Dacryopinax primogenitus (strain DJM 731) TaxID=1858805 RepID=M5G8C9_DACPD|nr:uncharacterized protein DACRYDRAFT_21887 [Dacryopinax primogenitus]EJU02117.1 hypothetical protein DACRYDRAFT_21887 [Dacryopinax primogenitus]